MFRVFKYFKLQQWLYIIVSIVLIAGQVWLDLKLPDYMSEITKLVQTEGSLMKDILIAGGYMLLCALGSAFLAVITGYFAAKAASALSSELREKVFNKVQNFSIEEMNKFSTASLITRTTNDIGQVKMAVAMGLQVLIKAPILAVWAVLKILGKSWQWSFATAISITALLLVIVVVFIFAIPKFKKIQKLTDNINKVTRESLTGARVVRAFNAEKYEENKFEKENNELTKTQLYVSCLTTIISPWMTIILSSLSLVIYWLGASLISGADTFAKMTIFRDMIVFSSYAMQVVMAFIMMTMFFIMLPRASVSTKRICEVLDSKLTVVSGNYTGDTKEKGTIEFKSVNFKYADADECILKNINFTAKQGETIAIIGSTGCGKSTLINLVPRFYDVTDGEILIDGVNIKDYDLKSLHNKIGYVSQTAVIFSGNIKENIDFGEGEHKLSEEDIQNAIDISQAKDFISEKENELKADVMQSGKNFSGGQKQRLSIARALAKKPEILIFDDSFSALDFKTDKKLRKALKEKMNNTTNLIVAQRVGTIMDADKIIVLENGEIVGIGKHKDLLENCEVYKEIALSQLSQKELR